VRMHKYARAIAVVSVCTMLGLTVSSCSGTEGAANGKTVSIVFSNYAFNSLPLAKAYYKSLESAWAKEQPDVKLNLIAVGGTDTDETNQVALLERSPKTAPDVVNLETAVVGGFISSGDLLPVNRYLPGSSFWKDMPANIQDLYKVDGNYYAVSAGNNDQALIYNKNIFRQAGLPVPWHPKTWADVLTAARQIKAKVSGVVPLWLGAGVEQGLFNPEQGICNLILSSSTPTMLDPKTDKWIVSSPGLVQTFNFYRSVFSEGLGPANSQNFSPDGIYAPAGDMKSGKLAITLGANWIPETWFNRSGGVYWPQSAKIISTAPIPFSDGQSGGANDLVAGWSVAISKDSPHPALDWQLIKLIETQPLLVQLGIAAGFIPPTRSAANSSAYVDFAPPFQKQFNNYVTMGAAIPRNNNFSVYLRALETATGQIAQTPNTTTAQALNVLSSNVTQQLGSSAVEKVG
jgi:multiple sugar transport system substrate-binding protein